MKKQLIAVIGLAVISAPAFATKARMIALGENINDNIGSLYFSDSRNIFQNAAYINDYKDMIIAEWGSSSINATSGAKTDGDKNPQAEGGFTKSAGKYAYGLYLGAESPYTNEIRSYTRSIRNGSFHQDNQLDAFFGGETSFKWGVNVTYSSSKDKSTYASQDSASLRLGAIWTKLEAFANVALMNQAKMQSLDATNPASINPINGKDEFKGKRGFELGATYNLDVVKVFGYVRHASWRHDTASLNSVQAPVTAYTGKFDGTYWLYQLGAGREHKVTDKTTIFTKVEYLNFARNVKAKSGGLNGQEVDLDDWRAPVTVGLEYDASSWLTLRGSVVQNLVGEVDNDYSAAQSASLSSGIQGKRPRGKRTIANSTAVNAGATLKFGNLSIDGVIGAGNNGTNGNTAQTTQGLSQTSDQKGILSMDNLMTRVAMTYRF